MFFARSHLAMAARRSGRVISGPWTSISLVFRSRPRRSHFSQANSTISSGNWPRAKEPGPVVRLLRGRFFTEAFEILQDIDPYGTGQVGASAFGGNPGHQPAYCIAPLSGDLSKARPKWLLKGHAGFSSLYDDRSSYVPQLHAPLGEAYRAAQGEKIAAPAGQRSHFAGNYQRSWRCALVNAPRPGKLHAAYRGSSERRLTFWKSSRPSWNPRPPASRNSSATLCPATKGDL